LERFQALLIAQTSINMIQITRTIIPIVMRMSPIVTAGFGIGEYTKTAPITRMTIASISRFW